MNPATSTVKTRVKRTTGGVDLGQESSREAKRLAAAILEVLAGARTPTQAAAALALSVPRYYQWEARALRGLLAACELRPHGRRVQGDAATLRKENEKLHQELVRQQSLVRLVQRAAGLAAPVPPPAKKGTKKARQRRPVARALTVAARLSEGTEAVGTDASDNGVSPEGK
jgi:hypothetical protein